MSVRAFMYPSLPGYLTRHALFTIMAELKPIRSQWYNLGLGLKVSLGDLDAIDSRIKEPFDGLREVLKLWLGQDSPQPTWQAIVDVLCNPVIDKKTLAAQLEEKYCRLC